MGIKTEGLRNLTTNGLVGLGYLAFTLAEDVANRLDVPGLDWEEGMGILGVPCEQGVDAFVRYGIPALLVTYGIKRVMDYTQDKWG